MKKRDRLKHELARRLSMRLNRRVHASEILDRREVAVLTGFSENHFTNGLTDNLPNYYYADETQLGPNGLFLYLREDVERRSRWNNQRFDWPPASDEPSPADIIKLLGGSTP
jgi:hypothetical protein